jgi:HSP20 family protein
MLMQNDPFRDLDFLFSRLAGQGATAPMAMPLDAYRRGDDVWVHMDLPGVAADSIDIDVERGVLTVSAERNWQREDGDQSYLSERPRGSFRRQVHLGESLDAEKIEADLHDGVLTLRIPVAEVAKPRKVSIGGGRSNQEAIETSASESRS